MKNLTFLFLSIFFAFSINSSAETIGQAAESASCTWKSWFKYPKNNASYNQGKSVYVRVDAQKYHDIAYMELYVNGKYVRKESSYPYEWCKGSGGDNYLRNLKKGTYKLKCRIKDKCGKYHEIYCTIYVKGGGNSGTDSHNGNNGACTDKAWYKYPQNGKYFNPGSNAYVRMDVQKYQDIKEMHLYVNGKFIRKESSYPYEWCKGSGSSDGYLRNLKPGTYKLKCRVYSKCGHQKDYYCTFYVKGGGNSGDEHTGGGNGQCKYKSWFKYPKNNATYGYGSDVYARVDTEKYQDIKEMHLYVNGKFVRKESSYPYEWAKGNGHSDSSLRNLKRGTYNLKCRIKTKCGKWYEYISKFYVR
ncbi:MAG: Ig-like domain-containing protein [Saprospiraceae bacterium]|nr:Ig-like domain-containing protein [Saprospiraceae bacterium]